MTVESERPTNERRQIHAQNTDVWATSIRTESPMRKGRGVWSYVRVDEETEQAYLSVSDSWLDVDMTAEACRHAVEGARDGSTLTIHVPLSQRWVVEGLRAPVDKRAAERQISLVWDIYCANQDGRSAAMEQARKVCQLGVAAAVKSSSPLPNLPPQTRKTTCIPMTSPVMHSKKCRKAATVNILLEFTPGGEARLNFRTLHTWDFYRSVAQWLGDRKLRHKLIRHRRT
jgi:hypothetical protein